MKQRSWGRVLSIFIVIAVLGAVGVTTDVMAETSKELRFMTGSPGGSWQAFGGVAKNLLEQKMPGLTVSVLPGGSGNNIMGIELGKADIGLSNSFTSVNAKKGRQPFKKAVTKIRHLVTLWPQWYHLVVRADSNINTVSDLKGKKLVTLKRGSAGEESTRDVLAAYGVDYKDLAQVNFQSSGAIAELMIDGHVDAGSSVGPVPASYFTHIAESKPVRFVGIGEKIEALDKMNPGYIADKIPAGSYKGQDKDVPTVSTYVHMIVGSDMDPAVAYQLTKILVENSDVIRGVGKGMQAVVPEKMVMNVGIEYHPGALKYFKEMGLLKK